MTVKDIVVLHLKANGFDGLTESVGDCACEVGDLMPCNSEGIDYCQPGYRVPCECGEGHQFHIVVKKPQRSDPCSDVSR
jgi:hypothetical protein